MGRQKCPEVRLRNAHEAVDLMRDEKSLLDPAPNSARRNFQVVGDLFDRVEFPELSGGHLSWHRSCREIDDPLARGQWFSPFRT